MPDRDPKPSRRACLSCGAPLADARSDGPCPACLMAEALGDLDTDGIEPAEAGSPSVQGTGSASPGPSIHEPDPLEGTSVGVGARYRLLQRIGEGGFGTVFMAEQTRPVRRRVAVKILKAGMDTRQVVARFEAERQALAMMDHANIAKVLDGGETEHGRPYFVMELVRGTPITAFCDREQLDTRARLKLFLQVCRAVQHAHQKGIIHRDLKPTNILVTVQEGAEPVPKVIDFGVAKAMEASLTDKTLFTRFEQMIGTPAYMSPEQAGTDAAANDIDTRADIYALGVLLYELLTGTTPLEPDTLHRAAFDEVRRILREQEAPRPSARLSSMQAERRTSIAEQRGTEAAALGRNLRGDLDWIVMKAIEKDRRRRYETATGFALDVERFLNGDPIEARPPSTAYRLTKLARRHRTVLATGTAIAATLVGATVVSTTSAIRAKQAEELAEDRLAVVETERNAKEAARQEVERQRDQALWNQYVAKQFPIREAWETRNFGHLERLLDELVPEPGQPDFRGWEWCYYKDQCNQAFTTIEGRSPAFHPTENALAVVRVREGGTSAIELVSPVDGTTIRTIVEMPPEVAENVPELRWSGDGSHFAYRTGWEAVVIDVRSGDSIRKSLEQKSETDWLSTIDLNADGSLLATGTWEGRIQVWDANTGEERRLLHDPIEQSNLGGIEFNTQGTQLAAALRWGRRATWDLKTGEAFDYTPTSWDNGFVAWNPDGTHFATTGETGVDIYELGKREAIASLPHGAVQSAVWKGAQQLVSTGNDQVVRIWNTDEMKQSAEIRVSSRPPGRIDVSRAGSEIAIVSGRETRIARGMNQDLQAIVLSTDAQLPNQDHFLAWDARGRHIASVPAEVNQDRSVRSCITIWNVASESMVAECEASITKAVFWNPDQTSIIVPAYHGGEIITLPLAHERSGSAAALRVCRFFAEKAPDVSARVFEAEGSPDGIHAVLRVKMQNDDRSSEWDEIHCIDAESTATISILRRGTEGFRWSNDGQRVAVCGWEPFVVWNPFTNDVSPGLKIGALVMSAAWAPDDRRVALGRADGQIQLIGADDLEIVAFLSGHTGAVRGLDWSANGRLASASEDGTIRVWDDATGDELVVFQHPDDCKFLSVRWSPDGRRLAAGDDRGRLFIWGSADIPPRPAGATGLPTGRIARHRGSLPE